MGVQGIRPSQGAQGPNTSEIVTDQTAMGLLSSLKETVHATAVQMKNFEAPKHTEGMLIKSVCVGAAVATLCPPVGLGIIALGIVSSAIEASLVLGINITGSVVAEYTRPPEQ